MGKKIVVLGGVGLIGTHLCQRLLGEGNEVFCIDTRDAAESPLLCQVLNHSGFRYVNHNIINSFAIRCDEIYNLAAPSRLRYDSALPVEVLKINVLGSINALEAARNQQAKVLFASSGDVYGLPYRESIAEEGYHTSSKHILAEGKRAAEAFHRAYRIEHGVDTRIARLFNTYGTGTAIEDQRVVTKMIVSALRNRDIQIYGSGEQLRTFCWVGDIVDGLVRFMQVPLAAQAPHTLNLGGGHEISIRGLAEKIVSVTGSHSKIVHIEARHDDPRRRTPELEAAKRELGWSPTTTLGEGLKHTVEYIEKELSRTAWAEMSWIERNS